MGKKRLEDALKKLNIPIKVNYRSFELDPTIERDVNENIYEKLSKKYGMTLDQAKATCNNMIRTAKGENLDFHFDTMILTNTFDAHRLVKFAESHGLMQEMTERLLKAFYTESKHIGDEETLLELAKEVGLDDTQVREMLKSEEKSEEVRRDEAEASKLGIRSIPFFLINKKYAITGAQPTDTFVQSIQQIIQQDNIIISNKSDQNCNEDGCSF